MNEVCSEFHVAIKRQTIHMKNNFSSKNKQEIPANTGLEAIDLLESPRVGRILVRWIIGIGLGLLSMLFLPWQQNIQATGAVTALSPENRPQTIQSAIPGQIAKWYVQEGEFVQKGDTILHIRDVQDEFFDPDLLVRFDEQITAQEAAIISQRKNASALRRQINALQSALSVELEQAQNRVEQTKLQLVSDSLEFLAALNNLEIAEDQWERWQKLYKAGTKSFTELQQREQMFQQAVATKGSRENSFLATKTALTNARMELGRVEASYLNDISSSESSLSSTIANIHDAERYFAQLRNQYANIRIRNQQYYMLAPQDGFVVRALFAGIGETISQGEGVVTIMPENPDKAVELYVRPMDVPLLSVGRKVRLEFDGWPALQFSGWPNAAVGTFGGVIKVIDYVETASQGGRYRILAVPDLESDGDWPDQLRLGSGVQGFALLEEVPVWYELWRLYNGFPPSLQELPEATSSNYP